MRRDLCVVSCIVRIRGVCTWVGNTPIRLTIVSGGYLYIDQQSQFGVIRHVCFMYEPLYHCVAQAIL